MNDLELAKIEQRIFLVRGQKVMLDADLAELYRVPTKSLNLAVKRNADRFPEDFTFQLTDDEVAGLRFHFETSKRGRGGRRYAPYAFTEQGVAMLSSVLRSSRAVQVNIAIMRTFVRLREMLLSNAEFARKLAAGPTRAFSVVKEILHAHVAGGIPAADALLLDAAVGLFDTEDARGGIKAFLQSGVADAAFAGR